MKLPIELIQSIEEEMNSVKTDKLLSARKALTERYKEGVAKKQFMNSYEERLAYIASRMPATYRAVYEALKQAGHALPFILKSHLDLGAGPGSALWASTELFPSLHQLTAFEKDQDLAAIGKRLAQKSTHPALKETLWKPCDLESPPLLPEHDLITLSYVIGELTQDSLPKLIENSFHAAKMMLLIIEPGTPQGFARILKARTQLLSLGAYIAAPCTHVHACPIQGDDWCHFAARVERSALHRKLKEGELSYEDEKFSYIAVTKQPIPHPDARVLRVPVKRPGHISLTLCTPQGLQLKTLSKKDKELYKAAKDLRIGDGL
jgi:ribosomal protein RSM22 (predicted rRNA methylase)